MIETIASILFMTVVGMVALEGYFSMLDKDKERKNGDKR